MKKSEIKIGGVYRAKVSDKIVDVRMERTNPHGGWDATNLSTGKAVRIKSAQRLRGPAAGGSKGSTKAASDADTTASGDAAATGNASAAEKKTDGTKARGSKKAARTRTGSSPKAAKDANGATVANAAGQDGKVAKGRAKKATGANRGSDGAKRMGVLDAAAAVLAKAGEPMRAQAMITAIVDQGLWSSPAGKTPHATLYAAIIREIAAKGSESRFRKIERGLFAFNG